MSYIFSLVVRCLRRVGRPLQSHKSHHTSGQQSTILLCTETMTETDLFTKFHLHGLTGQLFPTLHYQNTQVNRSDTMD